MMASSHESLYSVLDKLLLIGVYNRIVMLIWVRMLKKC